ncbi:MAG: iron-sulfur cluster assembly accessory protein [Candidatus Binatia bacterium]
MPSAAPVVTLTEKAAEMVKAAMAKEKVSGFGLRVGVVGGGCSGFQYHLAFEEAPGDDDGVFEQHGVTIFIDPASRDHLAGITLDYVTGLHGAGFKFLNPNASRTCGCGSSFATDA